MALLWKRILDSGKTYSVYRSTRSFFLSQIRFVESHDFVSANPSEVLDQHHTTEESNRTISVLEEPPALEDTSYIGPALDQRSFNFAAFVNHSAVLQKLVDLGVDFYKIEKRIPKPDYLIKLNFEADIQPRIQFLLDQGVPLENLGYFLTRNPYFFLNSLDDLQVRINYLRSKKFKPEEITQIISGNPLWLNYSTVEIDKRLGTIQKMFKLNGPEVRVVASNCPKLITRNPKALTENLFELQDVNQFTLKECKTLLVKRPSVWLLKRDALKERLEFMLIDMELPRDLILAMPDGLITRLVKLKERHLFLKSLGRAQYDPEKPNYVSIEMLTHGSDAEFCESVAKTAVETFNLFLKTL